MIQLKTRIGVSDRRFKLIKLLNIEVVSNLVILLQFYASFRDYFRCKNACIPDYDISNLNLNLVGFKEGDFTILQILIWIERIWKDGI